ncbi:hypothetical protein HPP92_008599 [Vanilla planifolia]|uniref:Uncharacterized protein n=1 Tax=Vanilla planifolia TaxID=51239 RepID=A0A835V3X0_VANPL|nr:hypothetical protein HPP92_008787 [Vanilla planifolia]KAG0486504.1 hypothetical protein HPP92_008599 [Vanilla planifolia]
MKWNGGRRARMVAPASGLGIGCNGRIISGRYNDGGGRVFREQGFRVVGAGLVGPAVRLAFDGTGVAENRRGVRTRATAPQKAV